MTASELAKRPQGGRGRGVNIQGECGTVEIGGVSMKVKDWAATAAPTGLLRADGSLCLDLLPMEYYGEAFRVVQGPLYNPESIDRDKVYATTSVAGIPPERLTD